MRIFLALLFLIPLPLAAQKLDSARELAALIKGCAHSNAVTASWRYDARVDTINGNARLLVAEQIDVLSMNADPDIFFIDLKNEKALAAIRQVKGRGTNFYLQIPREFGFILRNGKIKARAFEVFFFSRVEDCQHTRESLFAEVEKCLLQLKGNSL